MLVGSLQLVAAVNNAFCHAIELLYQRLRSSKRAFLAHLDQVVGTDVGGCAHAVLAYTLPFLEEDSSVHCKIDCIDSQSATLASGGGALTDLPRD